MTDPFRYINNPDNPETLAEENEGTGLWECRSCQEVSLVDEERVI